MLFLALVYFAVGQATVTRSNAQTAADAAALAAAQDAREQLRTGWLEVIADPAQWGDFLLGRAYDDSACQEAVVFAARNDATLALRDGCTRLPMGREGFRVTVRTTGTVGRSIVPETEARHANASAEAVIEPKCTFTAPGETEPTEPQPDPDVTEPSEEPEQEEEQPILGLTCDGEALVIDPDDPKLPTAVDLFTVRLAGDDE